MDLIDSRSINAILEAEDNDATMDDILSDPSKTRSSTQMAELYRALSSTAAS
jgi:hypothetical protein